MKYEITLHEIYDNDGDKVKQVLASYAGPEGNIRLEFETNIITGHFRFRVSFRAKVPNSRIHKDFGIGFVEFQSLSLAVDFYNKKIRDIVR